MSGAPSRSASRASEKPGEHAPPELMSFGAFGMQVLSAVMLHAPEGAEALPAASVAVAVTTCPAATADGHASRGDPHEQQRIGDPQGAGIAA